MQPNNFCIKKQCILFLCCITVLTFSCQFKAYGQDGDRIKRAEWFIKYRTYPNDTLPVYGYSTALQQRNQLRSQNGFFMASPWESIGPEPEAGGNEVYTGKINFIKYDPTHQNVVYIGAPEGGLWKSTNSGLTWNCVTENLDYNTSGDLAIDASTTPHTLYYGTGELMWDCWMYYGNGIYKSTDEGASWHHQGEANGLPNLTYTYKIAIDPEDNQHLLAAIRTQDISNTGLYQSFNGGNNWTLLMSGIVLTDCAFAPSGPNAYAGGIKPTSGNGYLISRDHGYSFEDAGLNICDLRSRITVCEGNPNLANYVYLITNHDAPTQAVSIYKSTDFGESFTNINLSSPIIDDYWSWYCLNIKVSPVNPNLVFVSKTWLYRSDNGCQSLYTVNAGHNDYHGIDFDPYDIEHTVMTGCDGGVYRSTNLGVGGWTGCNINLCIKQIYRINSDPYNSELILGGAQDNGMWRKSNPNSKQWDRYDDGDEGTVRFSNVSPGLVLRIHCNNGSWERYSNDYGINWDYYYGLPSGSSSWITPITFHPVVPNIIYTTRYEKVLKTSDGGANWPQIGQNVAGGPVDVLNVNSKDPNFMYCISQHAWTRDVNFYKSTNGGNSWFYIDINHGSPNKVPNRMIMSMATDPANPNEIIVGLISWGNSSDPGYIFRSQDGGYNWFSIGGDPNNGGIPDNPVNSLFIYYSDCNTKNYVAGTDIGVFCSTDGSTWQEIGENLPTAPCVDLDYNRLHQKLFVSAYGRSVWKLDLGGGLSNSNPIIVKDNLIIAGNVNINYDIIICSGGKLIFPNSCSISFAQGKKIIVLDGGQLDASSGNPITITSQSGTWGGIEFQSEAYGTLNNITFSNTSSPIVVNGFSSLTANDIIIYNCHFSEGQVLIGQRDKVRLTYSDFTFTNFGSDNSAIFINGSSDIDINHNTITFNNNLTRSTGISANYSNVFIQNNTISKGYTGIYESNCNSGIDNNTIVNTYGDPAYAYIGIELVNCYSTGIKNNTVTGYQRGAYLFNSSPVMLDNDFNNTNTSGGEIDGLHADYFSSPQLAPLYEGNEVVLDAGANTLLSTGDGNGIRMDDASWPIINYGYNEINGQDKYITGLITSIPIDPRYFVRCNDWKTESPDPGKFTLDGIEVIYIPFIPNCPPPGGGGDAVSAKKIYFTNEPVVEPAVAVLNPPTYMIVDRGYGHFDTLQVRSSSVSFPADQMLYMQANKEELLSNFPMAINKYKQVVSNYQDSLSALNSLKRIITCYDRMNADSSQYSLLREYYVNLAQLNQNDTAFCSVLKELAAKSLVRKTKYPQAITEYEDIIESSNDSSQILCAELNIIQTYMLIPQPGGDAPSFTGKLSYLKPNNVLDGYRKMQQLLHRTVKDKEHKVIPNEFSLAQNYPNPFNPYTYINYSLPKNTKVMIKVYDILGKLVKELIDEYKNAGNYQVKFDGSNFASGVYFYRLEAGDFTDVKKMVLIK